ncbi:MAG TPA: transposase [Chloroflexota bacterium]
MQRTVRLKLRPTDEQAAVLRETLRQQTACFNAVASYGWARREKNGVALHKATYYPLRAAHPDLPAQLVCAARVRATEAVKSALDRLAKNRPVRCPIARCVPIRYDARSYRMTADRAAVGLASVAGRQAVGVIANPHAAALLTQATGFDSADLIDRGGALWLHVVVTLPDVPLGESGAVVGVDLGLTRPAVTSTKRFLGARRWKAIEGRYFRLMRGLDSKGTPSALRHLRRLKGTRARFRRDCDHVLSRRVVQSVEPGTTIVVENLTDIRARTTQRGRASRRRLHSWSFAQLRAFLVYKAEAAGCLVVGVDPRHTSQRCPRCGHTARANRRGQARFVCRACGYELNADLVGAVNIAEKYRVGAGIAGLDGHPVRVPIVRGMGHGVAPPTHKPPGSPGGT